MALGGVFLVGALWGAPEGVFGQGTVVWQKIQPAIEQPAGTVWTYNAGSASVGFPAYTQTTTTTPTSIAPEMSGNDWWQSHENVYDANGQLIAIVACGRSFVGNWVNSQTCNPATIGNTPNPFGQETYATRWGSLRQTVALYEPDGDLLWFRYLDADKAYGVTVDRTGHLIIVGEAGNHEPYPETGASPSYFNPTPGNLVPVSTLPCLSASQLTITKMDLSGNVLWHHYYNTTANAAAAFTERCVGQHVVETNAGGQPGYRVVGWQVSSGNQRPCIIQVDSNGMLLSATRLNSIPGIIAAGDNQVRAMYISRCPFSVGERFAVTGYRTVAANGNLESAWVMYMDDAIGSTTDAEWTKDIVGNAFPGINTTMRNNANRVALTMDGTQPRVIWPVLYDFAQCNGSGQAVVPATSVFAAWDNREARGRVYKVDAANNGNVLWTSPDLGPFRAYDLYFAVKPMPNGDYAVASTRTGVGYGLNNPMDYSDLNTGITGCLNSPLEPNGLGYDMDGFGNPLGAYPWSTLPWTQCGHYGTDSYVAILRNGSGSLLWQYQWDEGLGSVPTTCFPENWRQRQCDFEITVDPAGDLLVCGNTGHNKDDGYLARIQTSCDAKADYSYFEEHFPLNANNEHHILAGTTVTWGDDPGEQDMNVRGSIVVDQGGTLIITGGNTVIRFADSRKMGYTCNIVVKNRPSVAPNAGDLFIQAGATVTSLAECPESMWDGVRVMGDGLYANDVQWKQGEVTVKTGGQIRNALVAITNCLVDPLAPTTAAFTNSGGIVHFDEGQLVNNRFGVVMRAYNPNTQPDAQAVSEFYNSQFLTTAALNYPDLHPENFLWFDGNRRMRIIGNMFDNTYAPDVEPTERWGNGIYARGTSVWVLPVCVSGINWSLSCAITDIGNTNHFEGLVHGVEYIHTQTGRQVRVHDAVMVELGAGIRVEGAANWCGLLRNNILVRSADFTSSGIDAAYGFGIWGQPLSFFVDNNLVEGTDWGQSYPTVGAIFDGTGGNAKRYYNNTFNFLGFGTFIQGINDGGSPGDGLEIKCNDYGITPEEGPNFYDIVFNDVNPSVGDRQGSPAGFLDSPAGNRFSLTTCWTGESNMYVPQLAVNTFTYWHHATNPNWMMKPLCRTNPPIADGWFTNTFTVFNKESACPGYIPLVGNGGPEMLRMVEAEEEHELLKQVYESERDGGNTETLKAYVYDPAQNSSDVRSALMLHAPRVSVETWTEVFRRETPLNPWHLAQALVANSPLQPEVVRMMEGSGLTPFYKDLVYGAQNGGVNSQTILESEMGYWKHAHAEALYRLAGAAMDEESEVGLDDVLAQEAEHSEYGAPLVRAALLIAKGEQAAAKELVDGLLATAPDPELEVLSLRLGSELAGAPPDGSAIGRLEELADGDGPGMFAARAWLKELGLADHAERIPLPRESRSAHYEEPVAGDEAAGLLTAYPNPSDGKQPVYVVVRLLEGMGTARVNVFDPTGREVLTEQVNSAVGIFEIPANKLSPGLYSAVIFADGIRAGSVKFEVLR